MMWSFPPMECSLCLVLALRGGWHQDLGLGEQECDPRSQDCLEHYSFLGCSFSREKALFQRQFRFILLCRLQHLQRFCCTLVDSNLIFIGCVLFVEDFSCF
ncbi:Uncharacterized protein Adt_01539 [Abeliophyllum distichum]|uniref:Secreted protein n=1 Tax=Abeliophyllum distichum TaxID=126358 RepID=A0ABD1VTK6_9LAMI